MLKPLILTVLLLPGALGSYKLSSPMLDALKQQFPNTRMVVYQQPAPVGKIPLDTYVAQVKSELKDEQRVLLVGHSLGGYIAGQLISEPQVVGAVLLAPTPAHNLQAGLSSKQFWMYLPSLPRFMTSYYLKRPLAYPNGLARKSMFAAVSDTEAQNYLAQMEPDSGLALGTLFFSTKTSAPVTRKPVLCMFGELDPNTNEKGRAKFSEFYHAPIKLYAGDHFFFLKHEAQVVGDIAEWVRNEGLLK